MSPSPTVLRRRAIPAFCVLVLLSACTPIGTKRWAGDYEAGMMRLQLQPGGEFVYDGGGCFLPHSDSDVGFSDQLNGRYRVDGRWIVLEPANVIANCSNITLKLYAHLEDGHRYLFDERYLRAIANDVRRGAPPQQFHPWHIAGEPAQFTASPDWLPAPYARWATMPPPSGQVSAVGPVQRRTRYGSAGRVEGEERFAMLTLDFGSRQGAYAGMPVCLPGGQARYLLDATAEHTSTLRWSWSASGGGEPEVGMVFESACR